jgi:hypothetical protein
MGAIHMPRPVNDSGDRFPVIRAVQPRRIQGEIVSINVAERGSVIAAGIRGHVVASYARTLTVQDVRGNRLHGQAPEGLSLSVGAPVVFDISESGRLRIAVNLRPVSVE